MAHVKLVDLSAHIRSGSDAICGQMMLHFLPFSPLHPPRERVRVRERERERERESESESERESESEWERDRGERG
jgi:hypothetical protein